MRCCRIILIISIYSKCVSNIETETFLLRFLLNCQRIYRALNVVLGKVFGLYQRSLCTVCGWVCVGVCSEKCSMNEALKICD